MKYLLLFIVFLCGCSDTPIQQDDGTFPQETSQKAIKLWKGSSREDVLQILGNPNTMISNNEDGFEVWIYKDLMDGDRTIYFLEGQIDSWHNLSTEYIGKE